MANTDLVAVARTIEADLHPDVPDHLPWHNRHVRSTQNLHFTDRLVGLSWPLRDGVVGE
jgi:hypothetical protein